MNIKAQAISKKSSRFHARLLEVTMEIVLVLILIMYGLQEQNVTVSCKISLA
jgi:hypothetical protein